MANSDGLKRLVIVESATKARKIQPYLGDDYIVEASVGHIRDLPRGAADVPARYKKEPWARLGVNVDNGFAPLYVVSADKKKKVADLKAKLKEVDELYLATDPDREGEAISWHVLEALTARKALKGIPVDIFDECTVLKSVTNAFSGCTSLSGESPYTIVNGIKYHLYDRTTENNPASGLTALTSTAGCFKGCTQLSDYAQIPDAWKQ